MSVQSAEQQRTEIRKLVEQVQRAVNAGQIRLTPELNRRIRQQITQTKRSREQGVER